MKDLDLVRKVIEKVNPKAAIHTCINGQVASPGSLLGSAKGLGAADWGILLLYCYSLYHAFNIHKCLSYVKGILDEHKQMLEAARKEAEEAKKGHDHDHSHNHAAATECNDPTHDHDHSHSHAAATACAPECNDPTHDHDHSHSHAAAATACAPECNDPTHDHDHSHSHAAATACASECNDPTHDHDHSHSHAAAATACAPECNDPTHNHDHSHSHSSHDSTTAEQRFGITSFVYQRRKPFHPVRFSLFLNGIGKLSIKGINDIRADNSLTPDSAATKKHPLLRSKGFVWMATSSNAAYFMSHAGQYLELSVLGRWWADIPRKDWPVGGESEIMVDFAGTHGDRRQELVCIYTVVYILLDFILYNTCNVMCVYTCMCLLGVYRSVRAGVSRRCSCG